MNRYGMRIPAPGPRVRRGLFAVGGVALAMGVAAPAIADTYECIPPAVGVFGLNGPPDWSPAGVTAHPIGKQLDDPRWNGSTRDDLPQFGGGTMPDGAFRALQDGSKLYLTLQAVVDPNHTTPGYDAVYIGFASASGATGKLLRVVVNSDNVQDTTDYLSTAWRFTGGAWAAAPMPAWAQNIAVWAGSGTSPVTADWAVNLMVDLAGLHGDADIGGTPTSNARFFYALDINTQVSPPPPHSTTLVWPSGSPFAFTTDPTPVPAASMNPAAWGIAAVGLTDPSCPTGVLLDPEHIGTTPIVAGIPSTTVTFGGGATATNTFVAVMQNPPATSTVKANFRLADWGSQIGDSTADWKSILPSGATVPINGDAAHPEQISWTCHETTGASDSCPVLPNPTAPTDQCLLVELASTGGITPVHFVQNSARRNLDFVHASSFTRNAKLSINGLAPLGGQPERDVYVYVKTTNMPAVVTQQSGDAGAGPVADAGDGLDAGKGGDAGRGQDAGSPRLPVPTKGKLATREPGPAIYKKSVFEALRDAWPTYEVHVYHDTGRTVNTGHGPTHILEPQVPFGYLVSHAGPLVGWRHALAGKGVVLDEISPNFYHVRVPNNGAVTVNTTIDADETSPPPTPDAGAGGGPGGGPGGNPPPPPQPRCSCDVVGAAPWSPFPIEGTAFGGLLLLMRVRRRKPRSQE